MTSFEDQDDDGLYENDRRESFRWWLRTYLLVLIVVFGIVFIAFADRIVVTVRSGESAVLFRWLSGTEMNEIYGEGLHLNWPWNRMTVYDVRLQTRERTYTMLTKGGLPIELEIAVRYQPDYRLLPVLHISVGPDYLNKVLFPETEAVLRRAVGQYTPEQIYTSDQGFLESIVVNSLTSAEDRYVIVDDVLVRSVELPPTVRDAVEQKITLSEQEKAYVFRLGIERQEAERKEIEAGGIKRYHDVIKQSLTPDLLRWQGIQATRDLAVSPNSKTVIIGNGEDGLPLILGNDR